MAEDAPPIGRSPQPDAVRAAMRHAIAHARDDVAAGAAALRMKAADDAAHGWLLVAGYRSLKAIDQLPAATATVPLPTNPDPTTITSNNRARALYTSGL